MDEQELNKIWQNINNGNYDKDGISSPKRLHRDSVEECMSIPKPESSDVDVYVRKPNQPWRNLKNNQ